MVKKIDEALKQRNLPDMIDHDKSGFIPWDARRKEILSLLAGECYGTYPDFELSVSGCLQREDKNYYGGKAIAMEVDIKVVSSYSSFTFPVRVIIPHSDSYPPVFFYLSFTNVPGDGIGEEIIDEGYALVNLYYQDLVPDNGDDFSCGAGRFYSRNPYKSWGKIAIWSWGASRVMDWLENQSYVDMKRVCILGHSRLGKTALWCGANDTRFSMVAATGSGGGGAALYRGKTGEGIENLKGKGSRAWFSGNFFRRYKDAEELVWDQHFLLGAVAPRYLYIGSAERDDWADPRSEFLASYAASTAYRALGDDGLIMGDSEPIPNKSYHDGKIGYHLRSGTHYLSRDDWHQIIKFRRKHGI